MADKEKVKQRQQLILDLTGDFCSKQLNDEYGKLAEKLVKKLARKRSVPFLTGKPEIWAAAVIHALGTVNFLFDKESDPSISLDDLNAFFGTNKSTTSNKARLLRDLLDLERMDDEFSTSDMKERNPFNKLVMVDGMLVPVSVLPEELQAMVKEHRARGADISFSTRK